MEELYKEYSKVVYNYLLTLTNSVEITEDLTQETFYSAVKNINKFKKQSSVKTWLCKIAQNKWIDYCKKVQKSNEISISDLNQDNLLTDSFEYEYLSKEQLLDIHKRIYDLEEKTKEIIYLRICTNLTFKEIGTIIGKSEEWTRTTFYRAKIKLKEDLKNEQSI